MAKVKLTGRRVEALEAGKALWDTEVRGLGVRRQSAGGLPVFAIKYRIHGRQRFATIGVHGSPWTCETARKEARRLLGEIASGKDVASERARAKGALTVAELAREFLERHGPKLKPGTLYNYRYEFRLYVAPALGKLKAEAVRHSDVAKLHHTMRDKPYEANRTLAFISKLFSWAEDQDYRPRGSNPAIGVERFREHRRERFLSEPELARLGATLTEVERDGSQSNFATAAVRMLLLTGARRDEIVKLQWAHVDLERGLLLLPDSKTGKKAIQLSAPAAAVLASVPKLWGNPYVFCGTKRGQPIANLTKRWLRIRRRAELTDVRLHDLRHSYASLAAGRGGSLVMIGALLGHANPSTTQRYAHLSADPLRSLNEHVGAEIERALGGAEERKVIEVNKTNGN
jgi:integrase